MSDLDLGRDLTQATAPLPQPERWRHGPAFLKGGVAAAFLLVAMVAGVWWWLTESQYEQARTTTQSRLELIAGAKRDLARAWYAAGLAEARRVSEAGFVRIFAADARAADIEDGRDFRGAAPPELSGQAQYLRNLLTEFVTTSRFQAAALVTRKGARLVTSDTPKALPEGVSALSRAAVAEAAPQLGSSRLQQSVLTSALAVPVFAEQGGTRPADVNAVAVFAVPVASVVARLAKPMELAAEAERVHVLQRGPDATRELRGEGRGALAETPFQLTSETGEIAFGVTQSGADQVFRRGLPVNETPWSIVATVPVERALAGARSYSLTAAGIAGAGVLAMIAGLAGVWWRATSSVNAAMATQYRRFAGQLRAQRELQNHINATVEDLIALKALDGRLKYANPALGRFAQRDSAELIDQDDTAVFGQTVARRLRHLDERARSSDETTFAQEVVHRDGRRYHLQFRESPFRADDGTVAGIVSVATDVSTLVEAAERREADLARTADALAQAVELRDPYLAGHSRRMAALAAATVQELGLTEDDRNTVTLAARLSQIGKLFVPEAVVAKPGRLSTEEFETMKAHVAHTQHILAPIPFTLPVKRALADMYERLDGSGYPEGRAGEDIGVHARVLAVADWFCARVEPRSYRAAISKEEALAILQEQTQRYDSKVVEALARVLATPEGDRILADLAA